jgi:NAD(P)-dependent dehydrogenase (short-subunit alcohol dehydrogenase family)
MPGLLQDRVALVTGAASGIGRAAALAFGREGAHVVVADIDVAGNTETAQRLQARGGRGEAVRADVTSQADVDALIARIVERHGRLDCAFNNAGIEGVLAPSSDYPEDVFAEVMRVNVAGVWRSMRAEIPLMVRQGRGAIVNASSVAGLVGAGGLSAYVASKHAVLGLTRSAAIEYARAGVRVNAVCPGLIDTPMVERLEAQVETLRDTLLALEPMGRIGTPDEVANAVVWLCSDGASFVTGHALAVDGGYAAQ